MDTLDDVDIDDDVDAELEVDRLKIKKKLLLQNTVILVINKGGLLKSRRVTM